MKPTRTLQLIAVALGLLSGSALTNGQTLYGTTGGPSNPGNLYIVNPATGFATLVGPLRDSDLAPYAVTGLAFDGTGTLYGATSTNSPTAPSELVTINPMSGLVTVVGAFNTGVVSGVNNSPETMADLTFSSVNNTLYGGGSLSTNLYSINLGSGQAASPGASGTSGVPAGVGIAANNAGTVFGSPNGAAGDLVTYNTTTGAATPVATITGAPFGANGSMAALAFSPSSLLYGVDLNRSDNTTPRASDLVTIDTTSGAVATIGPITDLNGNIPQFDAIVFGPAAVPEPSTWLAATLSLGIILVGLRRRPTHRRPCAH